MSKILFNPSRGLNKGSVTHKYIYMVYILPVQGSVKYYRYLRRTDIKLWIWMPHYNAQALWNCLIYSECWCKSIIFRSSGWHCTELHQAYTNIYVLSTRAQKQMRYANRWIYSIYSHTQHGRLDLINSPICIIYFGLVCLFYLCVSWHECGALMLFLCEHI